MLSLLFKQFYSNRYSLLFVGAMLFLFPLFIFDEDAWMSPVMYAVVMTWYFSIGMDMTDYKNDTDVLLNSLPVTRKQIVTSKYVTTLLVGLVFIAIGKIARFLTENHPILQLSDVLIAITAVAFFAAIYVPLYYKLGMPFMILALVVLTILLLTVFPITFNLAVKYGLWGLTDIWQQHATLLTVLFCAITVVAVAVSRNISMRLYENKEF